MTVLDRKASITSGENTWRERERERETDAKAIAIIPPTHLNPGL